MVNIHHLCSECYETDTPYSTVKTGKNICSICGGMVLVGVEIVDYIAQLKQELEYIRGDI